MNTEKIEISAYTAVIKCPHCHAEHSGWMGDPRGAKDVECEECGEKFSVPEDCPVALT